MCISVACKIIAVAHEEPKPCTAFDGYINAQGAVQGTTLTIRYTADSLKQSVFTGEYWKDTMFTVQDHYKF